MSYNQKYYYIYILTNKLHTVLYIGMTSNISRRMYEHQNKLVPGFTAKYNVTKLIYITGTSDAYAAVSYERKLKGWSRAKKLKLIELHNPNWDDIIV